MELTKKIFISAWMQISEFNKSVSFSFWITKISAFIILEELKNKNENESAPSAADSTKPNIFDQSLSELPEIERIVFVLHDMEKFSHEEVAELLVFPVDESKKLLMKVRLKLMKALF